MWSLRLRDIKLGKKDQGGFQIKLVASFSASFDVVMPKRPGKLYI